MRESPSEAVNLNNTQKNARVVVGNNYSLWALIQRIGQSKISAGT